MKTVQNKTFFGICAISRINSEFLDLCFGQELKFSIKIFKKNFQMMKYYRVIVFFPKLAILMKALMKKEYLKIFQIVNRTKNRIIMTAMTRIKRTRRKKN